MPTTPNNAYPYPAATDAPDGPGAIYNLAMALDAPLKTGSWTPGISGTGGATSGTTGLAVEGDWLRQGNLFRFTGSLLFGTGATWGTGQTFVTNLPFPVKTSSASGTGWYSLANGAGVQQVFFVPGASTTMRLLQPISGSSQNFSGALGAGDRLSFVFNAVGA